MSEALENIVSDMSDIMKERTLRLDFSEAPLKNRAFSEKPMSFVDEAPKALFGAIIDVVAIETGNRAAREHWQHKQLHNLLQHAAQRSAFWRERIGAKNIKGISLSDLPVLTRSDVSDKWRLKEACWQTVQLLQKVMQHLVLQVCLFDSLFRK